LKKEVNEEKSPIELKMLPSTLKYAFLDETEAKPVIISNLLSKNEEACLINVLKKNQEAMGWTLSDLKGISPSYYMHKILMEEDFKPVAQP
jgi:predicted DNA-binding protein (MmcQ/YjbR family)